MGYQRDQRLPSEIAEQEQDYVPPPAYRPALPPRTSIQELQLHGNEGSALESDHLTPDVPRLERSDFTWTSQDPRNASTDSLLPALNPHGKRTLLLIYIHGFMGNETSFQSFPAHVHSLVTELMVGTHIVHTKIYPKYKSRRAIEFARDEFSNWLRPHHSPDTDVILLGHSMGGILSAEVVLQPSSPPNESPLRNRILGTVNFDVPFLGMHPGVVTSGIGSLFRPGDKETDSKSTTPSGNEVMMPMPAGDFDLGHTPDNSNMLSQRSESSSLTDMAHASRSMSPLSIPVDDPNYNPRFENDVVQPVRKTWESALHFMTKHSGNLRQAAKAYVTSHVEFGGTMADYPKLHARYKRVRALEDINDINRARNHSEGNPRVRFVNFYTASTGVTKKKASSVSSDSRGRQLDPKDVPHSSQDQSPSNTASTRRSVSPRISVESPDGVQTSIETDEADDMHEESMQTLDAKALSDNDQEKEDRKVDDLQAIADGSTKSEQQEDGLPPVPPIPTQPADFDPTGYKDKDVLKVAQKEHSRKMKAYQSAVKDREKTISDRKKLLEKREKKASKEREKAMKEKEKAEAREAKMQAEKDKKKNESNPITTDGAASTTPNPRNQTSSSIVSATSKDSQDHENDNDINDKELTSQTPPKKKRDRKFCILPTKQNGIRDPTWRRVFMEGVDEVGAHCGLFFADKPHYEGLVGDVGEVVREWVGHAVRVREIESER